MGYGLCHRGSSTRIRSSLFINKESLYNQIPSERTVPDGIALMLLQEWARGQLVRHPLTGREQDLLQYMVQHGTVRSRDYKAAGFTTAQQLSSLLRSLGKKEYVSIVAEQGVAREYGLTGPAFLSLVGRGGELPRLPRSSQVDHTN